jgi:hypothetical protein
MLRRSLLTFVVLVAGFGLVAASLVARGQDDNTNKRGRKYKAPPPTARLEVTILKDVNGKPIENAAVVFHPMVGEKDDGNMELKTNEDGKAIIDILPLGGTVRVQVIVRGFQTYGEDYKVDKPDMGIEVRMKRPGEQYSIYKPHELAGSGAKGSEGAPAPAAAKDAATPTAPASPSTQPQTN